VSTDRSNERVAGLEIIFGSAKCRQEGHLVLAQGLVRSQTHYYDEILHVIFPYWNGRKLGIKEIEHALCEYAKFHRLVVATANSTTSTKAATVALYQSRSALDDDQNCVVCRVDARNDDDDNILFLCDTCNRPHCRDCCVAVNRLPDPREIFWNCPRCCRM
jgi:hypothetical protein